MKRFALTMMMTAALMLPAMYADEQIHDRKQNQQARVNARQNKISNSIYKDKHNQATQ